MAWYEAYDLIKPYLFRIDTEDGFGTGFLFAFNKDHSIAAIATAAHVVSHEHSWAKPIKLCHYSSRDVVLFSAEDRVMWVDLTKDAAAVVIPSDRFSLPQSTLPTMDPENYKKVGVEVGWVGFPAICAHELCFFCGSISAFLPEDECYLIDGVAINGVSGGPVFDDIQDSLPEIIGIVSAYMPSRGAQETTPGLLRAQDIAFYHEYIRRIQTFDEAKEQEKETQQEMDRSPGVGACDDSTAFRS